MNNKNGNIQINLERCAFNTRLKNFNIINKSKKFVWNKKRRFRTI